MAVRLQLSRMRDTLRTTRASKELDRILDERGPRAEALKVRFHRTHLWRLRTGRRVANLSTAEKIEKVSKGAIRAKWWLQEAA